MSILARVARTPIGRTLLRWFDRAAAQAHFPGSQSYWEARYRSGGNSGAGSYGRLAEFKAEFVNAFVRENAIRSVIEFGCGDGHQLTLARYPRYLGFDVSATAVALCRSAHGGDPSKEFRHTSEYRGERADLVLSLDVIFHLTEDAVFAAYMERLFQSADRFVIIYSSNMDAPPSTTGAHVRHRRFGRWVEEHAPEFELRRHVPNPLPYIDDEHEGSFADFYVYGRR
jgi:SAM-dependent methyltransferase